MLIEWMRQRHNPDFAERLKTYLFTEAPITEVGEDRRGQGRSRLKLSPRREPAAARRGRKS